MTIRSRRLLNSSLDPYNRFTAQECSQPFQSFTCQLCHSRVEAFKCKYFGAHVPLVHFDDDDTLECTSRTKAGVISLVFFLEEILRAQPITAHAWIVAGK